MSWDRSVSKHGARRDLKASMQSLWQQSSLCTYFIFWCLDEWLKDSFCFSSDSQRTLLLSYIYIYIFSKTVPILCRSDGIVHTSVDRSVIMLEKVFFYLKMSSIYVQIIYTAIHNYIQDGVSALAAFPP